MMYIFTGRSARRFYIAVSGLTSIRQLPVPLLSIIHSKLDYCNSLCYDHSKSQLSHLLQTFSQQPSLLTYVTSYMFNVLAVLALHPSSLLLGH